MAGIIEHLMEEAGERKHLEIVVRIDDGDRYAGLDIGIVALMKILTCGGIAEEVILFADGLYEDGPPHYGSAGVRAIIEPVLANGWTWVDCYERGGEFAEGFLGIISQRETGLAASDVLRLELVDFWRENPSVFKIVAAGTAVAVTLLAGCFSTVHVYREAGAESCRAEAHETARTQMELLTRMARLEGRWTKEHGEAQKEINAALNAAIAACGSSSDGFTLKPGKGGIELEISSERVRRSQKKSQ